VCRVGAMAVDLVSNLSTQRMRFVHDEFVKRDGVVDCATFVAIMKAYLPEEVVMRTPLPQPLRQLASTLGVEKRRLDDTELVTNLGLLFKEIDSNGSGFTSWSEVSRCGACNCGLLDVRLQSHCVFVSLVAQFSRYVVERRVASVETYSVDAIVEYTEQHVAPRRQTVKDVSSTPAIETAVSERALYVPSIDAVAVTVARSPVVRILDAETLWPIATLGGASSKQQKGTVEAITYLEDSSASLRVSDSKMPCYLVTSCSDSTIALWNMAAGPRQFNMLHRFSTPYSQVCLCLALSRTVSHAPAWVCALVSLHRDCVVALSSLIVVTCVTSLSWCHCADCASLRQRVLDAVQWQLGGHDPHVGPAAWLRDELHDGAHRHHHGPVGGAARQSAGIVQPRRYPQGVGHVLRRRETGA
jgi:hypothetical protein